MNWANDRFPVKAIAFLMPVTLLEVEVLREPGEVARVAGGDILLSFILGFVLATLAAAVAAILAQRFPGKTLVEINRTVLGRPLGFVVTLGYILFWIIVGARLIRLVGELVRQTLLPETPMWATLLYLVLVGGLLAFYGVEPVARLTFLILPLGYMALLFFALIALGQGEIGRLLPILADGPGPVWRGALTVARQQEGIAAIPLIFSAFAVPSGRILPMTLLGMGLSFFALFLNTVAIVSHLGTESVADYNWPGLAALQTVVLPGFLVEKLDLIFLLVWLVFAFGSVAVFYTFEVTALGRFLNWNRTLLTIGVGVLFFLLPNLSLAMDAPKIIDGFARQTLPFIFLYGVPLGLLAVSLARGLRGSEFPDRGPAAGERG